MKVLQTIYILNKYKLDSECNNNKYNDNNNSSITYEVNYLRYFSNEVNFFTLGNGIVCCGRS